MIHTYKLNGFNMVIDAASGAVHSVDDVAYDTIEKLDAAICENEGDAKAIFRDRALMDSIQSFTKTDCCGLRILSKRLLMR